jgi:anti-sigma factor RsiW
MICSGERLEAWVRGELPAAAAAALSQHVRSCEACRRESEWLRTERRAFAARRAVQDPWGSRAAPLRRSVEARLEAERSRIVPLRRRARAARVVRAVSPGVLAVLLALGVVSKPGDREAASLFRGSSCVSIEVAGFCPLPPALEQKVALEEDHFGACLMATPRAPPGSSSLCF